MGRLEDKLHEAAETLELAHNYMDNLSVTAERLANTSLTDDEVYDGCVFKGREAKARDLGIINQLRNAISHNHLVVNSSINYKKK